MTDGPTNRHKGKYVHAIVMVLVHNTSSECAFQMYEISLKYI